MDSGITSDNADSYALLSYENNASGTIGIAWLRSTCSLQRGARTSITEHFRGEIVTAEVIFFIINGQYLSIQVSLHRTQKAARGKRERVPKINELNVMIPRIEGKMLPFQTSTDIGSRNWTQLGDEP